MQDKAHPEVERRVSGSSESADRQISIPDNITLRDLWQNLPAKYVWKLVRLIMIIAIGAFALGGYVAQVWNRLSPLETASTSKSASGYESKIASRPSVEVAPLNKEPRTSQSASDYELVDNLRRNNQVRQIDPLQNGLTVDRLPIGVFGFVYGYYIARYIEEKKPFSVFYENHYLHFEFHKLRTGLFIVGFVSPADVPLIADPTHARAEFNLMTRPSAGMVPVAVEFDRIARFVDRDLPGTAGVIADVTMK